MKKLALGFLLYIVVTTSAWAADQITTTHTRLELIPEVVSIQPGKIFRIGLHFKLDPKWHTYYKNPGDSGLPPKVIWGLPAGFKAGELEFPAPKRITIGPLTNYGYEKEVLLSSQIQTPANLKAGSTATFNAKVKWLVCHEICLPASANLSIALPVLNSTPEKNPAWKNSSTHTNSTSLVLILAAAFIGGLILNLMPCVFPVLAIKVLSLVNVAHGDPKQALRQGIYFTAGTVLAFWILTASIFILKTLGAQIGWGFQLQSPEFLVVLIGLCFLLSLNLLGFFEISFAISAKAGSSFGQGILAVILATPCTAPFMGWAAGFALMQNFFSALLIFTAMALGLSLPYVLLTAFPKLLQKLPKPGAWMQLFKQLLAFPMLATAAWLMWVLSYQVSGPGLTLICGGLLVISFGVWLMRLPAPNAFVKNIFIAAVFILGLSLMLNAVSQFKEISNVQSESQWQTFSQKKLEALIAQKKPVFVDFTAQWCITCQVNKKLVLNRPEVLKHLQSRGYTLLVADWTREDPEITQALAKLGRSGVPTYVIYRAPDFAPKLLPEILTVRTIIQSAL